ncbi:MAG TPA: ParB/RepB/Spo0J family partition protein [Candidatus Acidoferrales bacterium]|nr:ParB/RepB/Spo0J family partition protein [Candidatus Acidoferrales bacterium]
MNRKRGLGRGLDALLGGVALAGPAGPGEALEQLPIEQLQRGRYQPRLQIKPEALADLADSIRAQGVLQPIVVRPSDGRYEIIAGERRWRAAQLAGLREVPCLVREVPDQAAMAIALIENIQREDLNPMEEALALARLQDEFALTHEQIAATVGRSRSAVTNLLRLNELEPAVRKMLEDGRLEMGHGRALLGLKGGAQCEAAAHVAQRKLTVRQTEALVRRLQRPKAPGQAPDPNLSRLQRLLSEQLGTGVTIRDRGGKGSIRIDYHSLEQLDSLLAALGKSPEDEFQR